MSELRDFTDFANKPLEFPFKGKKYVQPDLTIEAGLRLGGIVSGTDKSARNMKGAELWELVCGPLWAEMITDGVPLAFATRVGLTLLAEHQYGRDYAEATWEAGTDPKLIAAYMTEKAAVQGNRASRRSNGTGGATKTPSRAVTKGTTSPTM